MGRAEAGLQEDAAVGDGFQRGRTLVGEAEPDEELRRQVTQVRAGAPAQEPREARAQAGGGTSLHRRQRGRGDGLAQPWAWRALPSPGRCSRLGKYGVPRGNIYGLLLLRQAKTPQGGRAVRVSRSRPHLQRTSEDPRSS